MFQVLLTRRFEKNFRKFDSKTQARIKDAVLSLKDDPEQGKALAGDMAGEYSLRVGTYRVLYVISGDELIVETVRHRKDVYKRK